MKMEGEKNAPTAPEKVIFQDKIGGRRPSQLELRDTEGKTLLILAGVGKIEALTYLLDLGANVNAQDFDGFTALMVAVKGGHIDCVNLLLEKGEAKLHYQDNFGSTALHLAIQFGCNMDIIRTLVSNWADSGIRNVLGQKPINIIPSHKDDVRKYLSSSATERAGCLFKALGREFEDLTSKAIEMLVEATNSGSSIKSSSNRKSVRVSCYHGIYITGEGSDSDLAIQTSLSELITRYIVLRIALQHQISELAIDYGEIDLPSVFPLSSNSQCSITDNSMENYSDSIVSKKIAVTNIPTETNVMAEIQWCLEALSEICRIFTILFPHAKSLLEINKWSFLQEGKEGSAITNWITLPFNMSKVKDLPEINSGWGINIFKARKVIPIVSLKGNGKALAEVELFISKSFNHHERKGSIQPEDGFPPRLSIQNILFSQAPELYEQHLKTLSKESLVISTKLEPQSCMIC
jgi:hypothetical protein